MTVKPQDFPNIMQRIVNGETVKFKAMDGIITARRVGVGIYRFETDGFDPRECNYAGLRAGVRVLVESANKKANGG